ncbi:MAG: hypothetical protein MZV64_30820 [Ignavibacteriales bacterium]|nr:hypothetical protein [Ignavibacteriales bacterium]
MHSAMADAPRAAALPDARAACGRDFGAIPGGLAAGLRDLPRRSRRWCEPLSLDEAYLDVTDERAGASRSG